MNASPEASGIHDALPARTLGAIVDNASDLRPVLKSDLARGDSVVVVTKNSTYSICFLGGDSYSVAGGWFDHNNSAPLTVGVNGCTWGGSATKSDILAAPRLFLEFGNRVRTTRIQKVTVHNSDSLPIFN